MEHDECRGKIIEFKLKLKSFLSVYGVYSKIE